MVLNDSARALSLSSCLCKWGGCGLDGDVLGGVLDDFEKVVEVAEVGIDFGDDLGDLLLGLG